MKLKNLLAVIIVAALFVLPVSAAETIKFGYSEGSNIPAENGCTGMQISISGITGTSDEVYMTNFLNQAFPTYTAQSPAVITVLEDTMLFVEELVDFYSEGPVDTITLSHDGYGEEHTGWDICKKGETVTLSEAGVYYIHSQYSGYPFGKPQLVVVVENSTAKYTNSRVLVDGKEIAFEAYNVSDNNYFKLRDIATVLSGTSKQFEVTWDEGKGVIDLLSGRKYTPVGGELAIGDKTDKSCRKWYAPIYKDGSMISPLTIKKVFIDEIAGESTMSELTYVKAFNINDNNFFKLRDLGKVFNFAVGWDEATQTISIDSTKTYTE